MCPTSAIDITKTARQSEIPARDVIWATGFQDFDLSPLEEYGYGTHPDIMSSLQFEEWSAEAGLNRGTIVKKNDKQPPASIAFIQCAGARDLRLFPYCSAVCCMHALKQAQWVKRRNQLIECVIFFTDMRAEGRHYYEYYLREIGGSSIELIRSRPGLIYPMPGGEAIAVQYENTTTQTRQIRKFDMVVLNGALQPSLAKSKDSGYSPVLDTEGLLGGISPNIKSCGFCREPVDVEASVIQASSAALRAHVGEEQ
jgi:heterodisulfide reductase subunit A-like polyferredoxin